MKLKVWLAVAAEALVFAALLFGAAGRLDWPSAWAFLAGFFASALLLTLMLARHDPALLDERMKPLYQPGQPLWDKVLMSTYVVLFLGWLVLMGLDAGRYRWSVMPVWLQVLGALGVVLTMGLCYRVFRENTFLAPVVKIQAERGQRVISTGPYRIVRHPLYALVLLLLPAIALSLGSWWGLAASFVLDGALVVRTALEDRESERGLAGYAAYAERVRYRLVPLIW